MAVTHAKEGSIKSAKDLDEKIQAPPSHQEASVSDVVDKILVRKIDKQ